MTQKFTAEEVRRAVVQMRVVNLGELQVEQMLIAYADTLRQQGERGDVADLTNWQRHYSIGPAAMDALSNLLAPPLRAHAEQGGSAVSPQMDNAAACTPTMEQGGRVDGFEAWFAKEYPVAPLAIVDGDRECTTLRDGLREAWQAALAQNAQREDVGAIREVIAKLDCVGSAGCDHYSAEYLSDAINDASEKLTRAISGEKAGPGGDGWRELCLGLIRVVEGYPPQTWRNGAGERLKDTPEWCAFYVAATELPASPAPDKEGR